MATYEWSYGAPGTGLYFTITYDPVSGEFTVQSIEGSFDLNALWFSNGDGSGGDTTLSGSDSSLNMNGANTVWEDDGTESKEKIVWDDYAYLSSTGLGTEGEEKNTFISEGETKVFSDIALPDGWDFTTGTLGVRATSVNGDGSIKYADNSPSCTDELIFSDNFSVGYEVNSSAGAFYRTDIEDGGWVDNTDGTQNAEIVYDGYQGVLTGTDPDGGDRWLDSQLTSGGIDYTQTISADGDDVKISISVAVEEFSGYKTAGSLKFDWNGTTVLTIDTDDFVFSNTFETFEATVSADDVIDGNNELRMYHDGDVSNVGYAIDLVEVWDIC